MTNEEESNIVDPRIYEVSYLLAPTIPEENVAGLYGDLKELIASLGGSVISDEMPKLIELAYPMLKVVQNVRNKFSSAYFGWVKFSMEAEKVLELKKKVDLDPNIVRSLIIKTVKENTLASKRFVSKEGGHSKRPMFTKKENNPEEAAPINKEEVDKEIDAMISV